MSIYYYSLPGFNSDIAEFVNDSDNNGLWAYEPIDYLIYTSDAFQIRLRQLPFKEFLMIEKSSYIDDIQSVYMYKRNPFFITIHFSETTESEFMLNTLTNKMICDELVRKFMYSLYITSPHVCIENPLDYIVYSRCYPANYRYPGIKGREVFEKQLTEHFSRETLAYVSMPLFCFFISQWDIIPQFIKTAFRLLESYYKHKARKSSLMYLICINELLSNPESLSLITGSYLDDDISTLLVNYREYRNNLVHSGASANEYTLELETLVNMLLSVSLLVYDTQQFNKQTINKEIIRFASCGDLNAIRNNLIQSIKKYVRY